MKYSPVTRQIHVHRHTLSIMSGEYGTECCVVPASRGLRRVPSDRGSCGGFTFSGFLGQLLGNGALLEVTVCILKKGRLTKNPFYKKHTQKQRASEK